MFGIRVKRGHGVLLIQQASLALVGVNLSPGRCRRRRPQTVGRRPEPVRRRAEDVLNGSVSFGSGCQCTGSASQGLGSDCQGFGNGSERAAGLCRNGSSLFSVEWNFNAPRIRRLRGDSQLDA